MKPGDGCMVIPYTIFSASVCVWKFPNIKLKIKRNLLSIPYPIQRNPLHGEISGNLLTGEGAIWGHGNFSVLLLSYTAQTFFLSESVSVALR